MSKLKNACTLFGRFFRRERYILADRSDEIYLLQYDLEKTVDTIIPVTVLAASESRFKIIGKSTFTATKQRLMIDVHVSRKAIEKEQFKPLIESVEN